jgi:phage terminase small subunit
MSIFLVATNLFLSPQLAGDPKMKQRGRKSAASMSVVCIDVAMQRPNPPKHLLPEVAEVWRTTVNAMRPGWFGGETHVLLELYCGHVAVANQLSKAIDATGMKDLDRLEQLCRMRERESAMLCRLATKLRLTKQSSADSRTPKNAEPYTGPRPWD